MSIDSEDLYPVQEDGFVSLKQSCVERLTESKGRVGYWEQEEDSGVVGIREEGLMLFPYWRGRGVEVFEVGVGGE